MPCRRRTRDRVWWMSKNGAIPLLTLLVLAFPALAQPQHVVTHGTQSPAVTAGRDVTINYGYSIEQVQLLIKRADADQIADLSHRLRVTQDAAVTVLQIIGQQDFPF